MKTTLPHDITMFGELSDKRVVLNLLLDLRQLKLPNELEIFR
jgi:hypothetical protein